MPTKKQLIDIIKIQTEIVKLGLDVGQVMSLVVDKTAKLLGVDGAAVELVDGEEMVYEAAAGIAAPQIGLRLKRNASISGLCIEKQSPLICNDSETDSRVNRDACRQVGLRSLLVIPLIHCGEAVGVLKAMSAKRNSFSEEDVVLLGLLAELIAASMYFAALYDENELFHKATHDSMTGLVNRGLFIDHLRNAIARSRRDGHASGVLMIDMNSLKKINDQHGHRSGDAVLIEFAKRIQSCARTSDTVARLGGDEFGVVLTSVESEEKLDMAIGRFYHEIKKEPFEFNGQQYDLSASIGAAYIPKEGNDALELLELADQRMYSVKQKHHANSLNR